MPDLREQTLRSSLFVVRESLSALRQHVANLDNTASIDRVIREAEIMSTSLKKLHAYLGEETKNTSAASAATQADIRIVTEFCDAMREQRICSECGHAKPK